MNKQKLIEALDATSKAIEEIKNSIADGKSMQEFLDSINPSLSDIDGRPVEQSYTELLANRLAWSYSTMHPEYRVDSQFKNLGDMIAGSKISYVLNWVKKKGVEGLEAFFELSLEEQRKELQLAMKNYEDKIKDVFTKRFSQQ